MEWTEDLIFAFIGEVRSCECLWNPKDRNKRSRSKVKQALVSISEKMDMNVDDVKNKKDNLFQTYRNYRRKVNASIKSGSNVYKPSWIYYDILDTFLHTVYTPIKPRFSTDELMEGWLDQEYHYNSEEDIKPSITDNELTDEKWHSPIPRKQEKSTCVDGKVDYVETSRKANLESKQRDECAIYGELLAVKLRKIEESKRQLVMHTIDNIMFEAICDHPSNPPLYISYLNQLYSQSKNQS